MEPSSIWYHIYKLLSKVLSCLNPIKTKAIASTKKDRWIDARILADLLRGGCIAGCHVPDETVDRNA